MVEFRQILCPVDFSDASRHALSVAADLARRYDGSLTLLHVYPVPGYVLPEGFVAAGPEVLTEIEQRTRDTLQQWQRLAQQFGAPQVEVASAIGIAATEILRWTNDHPVDLVVMGSHGRTGLQHLLLGSVADRVVHSAHVPVLTTRVPRPA